MMLKILKLVQWAALCFLLLVVGVFWGVWLSVSRSYDLFSVSELVAVAKIIMPNLAMSMRFISGICILLLSASAYFIPDKKSKEFYLTLGSMAMLLLALLVTIMIEVPINNQVITWTSATVPDDWKETLDRWLFFNKIRTVAALASFVFFATALLNPFDFKRRV